MTQEQEQILQKDPVWLCAQCKKPAIKHYLERLPNGGPVYLAEHLDGSEPCRLGEIIAREKRTKKQKNKKLVTCPKCGDEGNLWTTGTTSLKTGRPEHERGLWIGYDVVHGKNRKPRHHISDTINIERAQLLDQLDRLLDKSLLEGQDPLIKKKRGPGRPRKTMKIKTVEAKPKPEPIKQQQQHQEISPRSQLLDYKNEIHDQCNLLLQIVCQNGDMDRYEAARIIVRIGDTIKA